MADGPGAVAIRAGDLSDLAVVAALEKASFGDPWSPAALLGELCPDALRAPFVAELDGRAVGYLMAWRIADQLHILNIAVDPAVRRRGVGTALLRAAVAEARACGLVELTLEVRRSNDPARGFYGRHGFAETGVRPRYYADNGEDALIMTRPVAAGGAGD